MHPQIVHRFCVILMTLVTCKVKVASAEPSHLSQISPDVKFAEFDKIYQDVVNSTGGVIYEYRYTESKNKTTAVRISVDVRTKADRNFPVFFVTKQQQGILSWQIPMYLEYVYTYNKVSRTLCPIDLEHRKTVERNQTIYVDISTLQQNNTSFDITATILTSFEIHTGEKKNSSITPSEPQYFMYTFPSGVDSVVVQATSEDNYCMVLSVQDVKCPVMDQDRDIKFNGVYQTMSQKAAITIEKMNYDSGSVYIVMVLKPSDYDCNSIETIQEAGKERKKTVSLYVYGTISAQKYWIGIVGAAGVFLAFYIVAFAIGVCYHGCDKNRGIWTFSPHDKQYVTESVMMRLKDIEVKPTNQTQYHATIADQTHSQITDHNSLCTTEIQPHMTVAEQSQTLSDETIQPDSQSAVISEESHSNLNASNKNLSNEDKAHSQLSIANEIKSNDLQQKLILQFTDRNTCQPCEKKYLSLDFRDDHSFHGSRSHSPVSFRSVSDLSKNSFVVRKSKKERLSLMREAKNHPSVSRAWLHDGFVFIKGHNGVLAEIGSASDIDKVFATPSPISSPPPVVGEGEIDREARESLNPSTQGSQSYGAISDRGSNEDIYKELEDSPAHTATSDTISEDSLDTDDIDFLNDVDKEKDVFRTKTALYVCDLARKKMKRQDKNYKIYWRNLVAISIFYGLPVIQLVITYQNVLHITGDQDICYYNFDCAHPLGVFTSFNNVFSNIGYIMLGFLFLILVYRRSVIYRKVVEGNPVIAKKYGIPQHSGLFYAMGLALCMEGIMSACYHVCPTYSNFQFDTSYMYIIACLCMLRIYQNRHPDISAKAHTSYLLMALVIFIAVIGVIHGNSVFWILFACCDIVLIVVLSVHIYYMGRWKLDAGIFKRVLLTIRHDFLSCSRPMYMDRFIMLIIVNILNWSFAIYGAVTEPADFASFLLGIFIGNLLLYCTFYIIMKLRYGERIHPLAIFCIIAACIVWGFALYFFFYHLTSWQLTPSGSRAGNQKCMIAEFYDAHDVWHFLSATSMFFSFLILLTLDDDLFSKRRDHIPVF